MDTRQPCSPAYQVIFETIHFLPLPGIELEPSIDNQGSKVKNIPLRHAYRCCNVNLAINWHAPLFGRA